MANIIYNKLQCFIVLFLAFSFVLSDRFAMGRAIGTMKTKEFVKHKGTIKSIQVMMSTKYFFLSFLP